MRTILLIEPFKILRDNIKEILELYNYKIKTVANFAEGFKIATNSSPDIIICDSIYGTNKHSDKPLMHFRRDPNTTDIPVLMTSTCDHTKYKNRITDMGAQGLLVKPFLPELLVNEIQRLVPVVQKQSSAA